MDVYDAIRALCLRRGHSVIACGLVYTKCLRDGIKIIHVECKHFATAQTTGRLNRDEHFHFLGCRSYRRFYFLRFQDFFFVQASDRRKINVGMIPVSREELISALIHRGRNYRFHHTDREVDRMRRLPANTLHKMAQVLAIDRFQREATETRCLECKFHCGAKGCERRCLYGLPFSHLQLRQIVLRALFESLDHRFAFSAARITSRAQVEAVLPSDCAAFTTASSSALVNVAVTLRLRTSAAFIGGLPSSVSFFPTV